MNKLMHFRCDACGGEWVSNAKQYLKHRVHPCNANQSCSSNSQDPRRNTLDDFKHIVQEKNPDAEIIADYIDANTPLLLRCKKCGKKWYRQPNTIVTKPNVSCPFCTVHVAHNKMSHEDFVKQIAVVNPNLEITGRYVSSVSKVGVRCKICGYEWATTAGHLSEGHGCPQCNRGNATEATSFMEQFLFHAFRMAINEKVLSRDMTAIGKELDIYIPALRFAIEIGSWYWHESKVCSDRIKSDLCCDNGIMLDTIYTSVSNVKLEGFQYLMTLPQDLSPGTAGTLTGILNLTKGEMERVGIASNQNHDFWLEAMNKALNDAKITFLSKEIRDFLDT